MKIEPFLMERMQSTWEHRVEINLSESGVVPLTVRELVDDGDVEALLDEQLAYVQSNGSEALRLAVAALYPGAGADHVEITTGCAEANYLVAWQQVEPGDEVVMTLPNYMQTWGLSRAFGADVKPWRLRPDPEQGRWRPDLDELRRLVGPRTRLILLCTPNNPTGSCLTAAELDEIAAVAAHHGAWILSDEVYRGAELAGGEESPSMWGRGERVLVTNGLSKAYGLPGLRIGWIAGPPKQIADLWSRHDYTTIAPSALSDRLATLALEPGRRRRLLERTRAILRRNLEVIESWLGELGEELTYLRPQAGAMLYLRYRHAVNSTELVERLRRERGVLVVPGDHYGMDGHLRIGYGYGTEKLREGLSRIAEELAAIAAG